MSIFKHSYFRIPKASYYFKAQETPKRISHCLRDCFSVPPVPPYDTTAAFNHKMNTLALSTLERLVKLLIDNLVSLGAFGTYDLIIHYPNYFAAAFTQSGQANVALYPKRTAGVPLWIFHGGSDDVINPWPDRSLIKALQHAGAKNAKYTEYPGVGHQILANVFAKPALLPWLFSFKK